jgi:hypothetical protein
VTTTTRPAGPSGKRSWHATSRAPSRAAARWAKASPGWAERDLIEVALEIKDAVSERTLGGQRAEHPLLDGLVGDQVDDRDGVLLVLAPGTGDALLELRRIPRQVAIDDDTGILEVEADAPGVGAEKDPAGRVVLEGTDLDAAFLLGHGAGVPSVAQAASAAEVAHEFEHAFPLGEDDGLYVGRGKHLVEDPRKFLQFRAGAIGAIQDVGRVAQHAHDAEFAQEPLLFLRRERPAFGEMHELADNLLVAGVVLALGLTERDEEVAVGAAGQFGFDVALAPAEQDWTDALVHFLQLQIGFGSTAVIEAVEFPVEAKKRPEDVRVEERDDRVQLIEAVLDGRARENEGKPAAQALDGLGGLAGPVFDPLGLIQHDDVGPEACVHIEGVGEHLLVVDEGEERRVVVGAQAGLLSAIHNLVGERREALDLLFPLGLERGGSDDDYAAGLAEAVEEGAGGDGLDRFAQTHFVGQQRAAVEGEMQHALALVRIERNEGLVRGIFAGMNLLFVLVPEADFFLSGVQCLQPGRDCDGQPYSCSRRSKQGKCLLKFFDRLSREAAVGAEPAPQRARELGEVSFREQRRLIGVRNQIDARRIATPGGDTSPPRPCFQVQSHCLHVFTGAEAVDLKILAGATEAGWLKSAYLDLVGEAAAGLHLKVGKNCVTRIEIADRRRLFPGAQDATVDLVLIGRAPIGGMRELDLGRRVGAARLG